MLLVLTRRKLVRGLDVWSKDSEIFAIVERPTVTEVRLCEYIAANSTLPSWSSDPDGNRIGGELTIVCHPWETTMDVVPFPKKEIDAFLEEHGKYKPSGSRLTIHWAGGDVYCQIPEILESDPEHPKREAKPHIILERLFALAAAPRTSGRNPEGDGCRVPCGFGSGAFGLCGDR